MKDNGLNYCTTIAFSAAMIGFGLAVIGRTGSEKLSAFFLAIAFALWLAVCFGSPIAAGCRWLRAAFVRKRAAMRTQGRGGEGS